MDGTGMGQGQVRRGRRRFLLAVAAVVGVGAVGGFLAGRANLLDTDTPVWEGEPPGWASVLGLVLLVVGVVVMFGGFVWLVRSGRYTRNAASPLWAQSWSRRRDLVRQVKGKAPVRDDDLSLLRQTAEQLADQRRLLVPLLGLTVIQIGQVFLQWTLIWLVLAAVLGGTGAVALVVGRRDERLAREFLRTHPA